MGQLRYVLITICLITLLSVIVLSFDKETIKVKPFVTSKKSCFQCHDQNEDPELFKDLSKPCDTLCQTCHKEITKQNHHETGIRLSYNTKIELPLTKHDRIRCITCHDINIKRFDTKSWKAESLFDRTFKKKKKYKTYYLRIRNNEGKLCQNCH